MPSDLNHLLENVYWSFAEPIPESPSHFIEASRAYSLDVGTLEQSKQLEKKLHFSDVLLEYEHYLRGPDGEWKSVIETMRIVGRGLSRLTGAEVLWELHVGCANTIGQSDQHFFEGLELVRSGTDQTPPVYRVLLGS